MIYYALSNESAIYDGEIMIQVVIRLPEGDLERPFDVCQVKNRAARRRSRATASVTIIGLSATPFFGSLPVLVNFDSQELCCDSVLIGNFQFCLIINTF